MVDRELKAAAERVRRHNRSQPGEVVYKPGGSTALHVDLANLAWAWLAEHPADAPPTVRVPVELLRQCRGLAAGMVAAREEAVRRGLYDPYGDMLATFRQLEADLARALEAK